MRKIDAQKYELAVLGYTCPFPELYVTRALQLLAAEQFLEVTSDNPASCEGVTTAAKKQGEVQQMTQLDNTTWKFVIKKK